MGKPVIHSKPQLVREQDARRAEKMSEAQRMDGWSNVVTLLGTTADKRTASKIHWEVHDPEFFEQLYAGGGIPARIVDLVPEHALRHWIEWEDTEDEEEDQFEEACQMLNLRTVFSNAWKWGRAYGGGLIYIVTDTTDPSQPLRNGERVLALQDLSRWDVRIMTTDIEYDMGSTNYGKPRIYYLNVQMGSQFKGYPVHWTRMVRFDGQLVPRRTYIRNNYWHDSILNRVYNSIRNYEVCNDSVAACLLDFNVDVFKMKGLANLIAGGNEAIVKSRIETMAYVKSVLNGMLIDSDNEEYDNKSRSLEGVAELVRIQADRLVADTDIAHTVLLGESPEGSNATGNSTSQNWYNYIGTEQRNYAKPKLRRLFKIIFPGRDNKFHFNSLRVLDDAEKADLHLKQAQADAVYLEKGVLDPSEVAESRFGGKEYSIETELDLEGRESGMINPGANEFEEGTEGDENSESEMGEPEEGGNSGAGNGPTANAARGKKPKPKPKGKRGKQDADDVFPVGGDQPPEGWADPDNLETGPSETEPEGDLKRESGSKDPEGFAPAEGTGVQGLGNARKNPGTAFDLRNEVGEKANTVPKTTSFIGQSMSEPMRDPKTDPLMKGPGIPIKGRSVLPTRGTGIVAQSGYDITEDPKLKEPEREGAEGQSIEPQIKKGDAEPTRRRAATILVRKGDHFLMAPTKKDGRWTTPGGKIEDSESAHQGAVRELAEETGIKAGKLKFLGTRLVEPEMGKNVEVHMYEHHLKDDDKVTHTKDPDKEVQKWRWFSSKEPLPQDILGNLKHSNNVLLDYLSLLK